MALRDPKNEKAWDLMLAYRRVFNTEDGREVLEDILFDLKFFDALENQADATLHNAAKALLFKCGILQDFQTGKLVEGLFSLPYTPPNKGDKVKEKQ